MSALTHHDLATFTALGITEDLLIRAGIERVSDAEAREKYGIRGGGDMAGISFPYFDPVTMTNGRRRWTARIRRDHPELEDGKPHKKYVAPYGDRRHLYFPPTPQWFADSSIPIILVEAEKSALALTALAERSGEKFLALAMGGCYGWRGKIGIKQTATGESVPEHGAIPDLNICRDRRTTYVLLDLNVVSNPHVLEARRSIVKQLRAQAADVKTLELPEGAWNGPDDYIAANGDAAMLSLIRTGGVRSDGGEIIPPHFSDDALALRFSELHADELRYVAGLGKWLKWDGQRWAEDKTLHVFDMVRKTCREAASECTEEQKSSALRLTEKKTSAAVEWLIRSDRRHAATVEQWDSDPWVLNTPDGIVDLRNGEMRRHNRADYVTKITAATPSGDCPLWRRFLDRVTDGDKNLQSFLQRMTGYALTGSTREECLFFLYGLGANGKSKFIGAISGMMGDYAKTAPIETFVVSTGERHPTDLAGLQGARLVSTVETEDGRRWAEAKVKALTGGDRVAARKMRQDFFEYTPQFKLIAAGNHKPGLRSVNEAIRRRFHLVPFNVTIPEAERDLQLADKLREEWPGILQWAVEGCLEWQHDGLNPPAIVQDATNEYLANEDHVVRWMEDCCSLGPRENSKTQILYKNYCAWCEANNERALSSKEFSPELDRKGYAATHTMYGNVRNGIGLRSETYEGR